MCDDKSNTRKDRVDAMVHALKMIQKYAPVKTIPKQPQKIVSSHDYYWQKEIEQFRESQGFKIVNQVNPESQWAKNVHDYY